MTLRLTSDPRLKVSDDLHGLLQDGELSLCAVAAARRDLDSPLTRDSRSVMTCTACWRTVSLVCARSLPAWMDTMRPSSLNASLISHTRILPATHKQAGGSLVRRTHRGRMLGR